MTRVIEVLGGAFCRGAVTGATTWFHAPGLANLHTLRYDLSLKLGSCLP